MRTPITSLLLATSLAFGACASDAPTTLETVPATGSPSPEAAAELAPASAPIDASTGYIDPVCRMQIAEDAPVRHTHDGVTYGFCSERCLSKFEEAPDEYLVALEE